MIVPPPPPVAGLGVRGWQESFKKHRRDPEAIKKYRGEKKEDVSMLYIANAFSISMLSNNDVCVRFREVSSKDVVELLTKNKFESAIGHAPTAEFASNILKIEIPVNRISIQMQDGDELIVLQLLSRLPEGVVLTQEELVKIPHKWYLVQLLPDYTLEAVYHW